MDTYRRAGRGGAGNYYSQQQLEEAAKGGGDQGEERDLRAQKSRSAASSPLDDADPPPSDPAEVLPHHQQPAATASGYARSGRGGAGNFVNAFAAIDAAAGGDGQQLQQQPHRALPHYQIHSVGNQANAAQALAYARDQQQQQQQQPVRYSGGRGGAGNWTTDAAQQAYDEEQERRRKAALDAKVFDDVKAGLAEPKRAYQQHGPGHVGRGRLGVAGKGDGADI